MIDDLIYPLGLDADGAEVAHSGVWLCIDGRY